MILLCSHVAWPLYMVLLRPCILVLLVEGISPILDHQQICCACLWTLSTTVHPPVAVSISLEQSIKLVVLTIMLMNEIFHVLCAKQLDVIQWSWYLPITHVLLGGTWNTMVISWQNFLALKVARCTTVLTKVCNSCRYLEVQEMKKDIACTPHTQFVIITFV